MKKSRKTGVDWPGWIWILIAICIIAIVSLTTVFIFFYPPLETTRDFIEILIVISVICSFIFYDFKMILLMFFDPFLRNSEEKRNKSKKKK